MNIISAKYQVDYEGNNRAIKTVIDGQEMSVPLDENNRHFIAIQEWLAEGNTIEEAD